MTSKVQHCNQSGAHSTSSRAHSGGPGQGLVGGSTKGLLGEIVLFISCFFKVMLILFQHVCFELFKVVVELPKPKRCNIIVKSCQQVSPRSQM